MPPRGHKKSDANAVSVNAVWTPSPGEAESVVTRLIETFRNHVQQSEYESAFKIDLLIIIMQSKVNDDPDEEFKNSTETLCISAAFHKAVHELISKSSELADSRKELGLWKASWLKSLQEGHKVDVLDEQSGLWCECKVLEVDEKNEDGERAIFVHFQGWDSKYDLNIPLVGEPMIAPANTFSKAKGRKSSSVSHTSEESAPAPAPAPQQVSDGPVAVADADAVAVAVVDKPSAAPSAAKVVDVSGCGSSYKTLVVEVGRSKSGRVINRFVDDVNSSNVIKENQAPKEKKETGKKRKSAEQEEDNNDWVCSICEMMEDVDDTDLLLCDGPCLRSFHLGCLKKTGQTVPQDEDSWKCEECLKGRHTCFLCKKKGKDYKEVNRCSASLCGKYYHRECLENPEEDHLAVHVKDSQYHVPDSEVVMDTFSFKCTYHSCDTCSDYYKNPKNLSGRGSLKRCIRCPRAFHTNCLPPGSRHNNLCIMCPRHPNEVLPSAAPTSLKKGDRNADPNIANFWEQMVTLLGSCDDLPDPAKHDHNHFKLQCHLKEEVENTPQNFKTIYKNDYDSLGSAKETAFANIRNNVPEVCCLCVYDCGGDCLNRILRIECCEYGSKGGKKESICKLEDKSKCTNRMLQRKNYSKTKVFKEFNMGCGLRAIEFIPEGALVIEYLGEVIDQPEVERRMSNQRKNHPSDHDFYIMELENGMYCDGKFKGNDSRFINHSCDPNCELQRWVVNGFMRIAIVAIKDVPENEPLSYDYQFDTNETEAFKCFCGSTNCRGTMAPKKKEKRNGPMTAGERRQLLAVVKKKELKAQKKAGKNSRTFELGKTNECDERGEMFRCYTGRMIPGDAINELKNGPVRPSYMAGAQLRVLLRRTVIKGSNLLARREERERRGLGK